MTSLERIPQPGEHRGVTPSERRELLTILRGWDINDHKPIELVHPPIGRRVFDVKLAGVRNQSEFVDAGAPVGYEWFVATCEADGSYVAGYIR